MLAPNGRPGTREAPTTVGSPPKSPLCVEVAVFTVLPSCRSLLRCPTTLRPLRPCCSTCLLACPPCTSRTLGETLRHCYFVVGASQQPDTCSQYVSDTYHHQDSYALVRLESLDPCTSPLLPDFVELGSLKRLHFDRIFFLFHFSHMFSYGTKWIEW